MSINQSTMTVAASAVYASTSVAVTLGWIHPLIDITVGVLTVIWLLIQITRDERLTKLYGRLIKRNARRDKEESK